MKRFYSKQWDQMFDRLLKFKEEHGHCLVPKRYPADQRLGTWVHTQRIQFKKLLSGKTTGDTQSEGEEESEMSAGKSEDEMNYRLTDDRRKRLEEIGFCWSAREGEKTGEQGKVSRNSYDDQRDAMFLRLKHFKEKHGHCLVPKRHKEVCISEAGY